MQHSPRTHRSIPQSRKASTLMVALLLMAAGLAACDDDEERIYPEAPPETIGPEARQARLIAPLNYDRAHRYPLVLMLHGYQVTSELQDIVFGLMDRVDSRGFILLMPEGTPDSKGKQFWNATEECCNFDGLEVDDVSYLSELVEEAARQTNIDRERITVVGQSNGGYMAFRLACDRPDLFRRAASVAGSMPADPAHCAER